MLLAGLNEEAEQALKNAELDSPLAPLVFPAFQDILLESPSLQYGVRVERPEGLTACPRYEVRVIAYARNAHPVQSDWVEVLLPTAPEAPTIEKCEPTPQELEEEEPLRKLYDDVRQQIAKRAQFFEDVRSADIGAMDPERFSKRGAKTLDEEKHRKQVEVCTYSL